MLLVLVSWLALANGDVKTPEEPPRQVQVERGDLRDLALADLERVDPRPARITPQRPAPARVIRSAH